MSYEELAKSLLMTTAVQNFSTGLPDLDNALMDGLPKGKILELHGPSDSGKTAFALHLIREVQNQGGIAVLANVDNNINMDYVKGAGIDEDCLVLFTSNRMKLLLSFVKSLAKSKAADLLIIDSVANLLTESERKDSLQSSKGINYEAVGKMLSDISVAISGTNLCVVCVNQLRGRHNGSGAGSMPAWQKTFRTYASARMSLHRGDYIREGQQVVGFESYIRVLDNKLNSSCGEAMFPVYFESREEIG